MSLLDLEDPPPHEGSLTERTAYNYGEELSGDGQQSSKLMYSLTLFSDKCEY